MSCTCTSGRHWRAVGLEQHVVGGDRVPDEVVDDHVGADARRQAVRGGVPQERGTEVVVREQRDVALAHTFDSPYGVTGLNAACSSSISPPDDGAVEAARRGEQEAGHAGLLRELRQVHARPVVDVVGDVAAQMSPSGSLESAARWITASNPSRSRALERRGCRDGSPAARRARGRTCTLRRRRCRAR